MTSQQSSTDLEHLPSKAQAIVQKLGMQVIPHEGPWFLQTFKSPDLIEGQIASRYSSPHYAYTSIYHLISERDFSAMHRLVTDEVWHFYDGAPLELLLLYPDGQAETAILGRDILAGQHPQYRVAAGVWMGARTLGKGEDAYSFGGNTMSPGFEYSDYEPGYADELSNQYPDYKDKILEYTREDSRTRPEGVVEIGDSPDAISVRELLGRATTPSSEDLSIALFTVAAGESLPSSFLKTGAEALLIKSGEVSVAVGGKRTRLRSGQVIDLPPKIPHSIEALSSLEFYAICSPAFCEDDMQIVQQ